MTGLGRDMYFWEVLVPGGSAPVRPFHPITGEMVSVRRVLAPTTPNLGRSFLDQDQKRMRLGYEQRAEKRGDLIFSRASRAERDRQGYRENATAWGLRANLTERPTTGDGSLHARVR